MAKKRQKQIIAVRVGTPKRERSRYGGGDQIVIYDTQTFSPRYESLDYAIKTLAEFKNKFSAEFTDLSFDEVRDCGCYSDCHCSPTLYLQGRRLETDLEFNFRIEKEDKQEAERLERERKEFERLKKQFGA
jgi:hypothetical protein